MTDLATALADTSHLGDFEGRNVIRSAIEIPNAAGGLREAMKVEPLIIHHGEKRYVVLEVDCAKVRFDPISDTDALSRVQVLHAVAATFVDEELVRSHLDEQARRIRKAKEDVAGQGSMTGDSDSEVNENAKPPKTKRGKTSPDEEDETIVLERQHSQGVHADGLREGCPMCDAEAAATAAEERGAEPTPITKPAPRRRRGSAARP